MTFFKKIGPKKSKISIVYMMMISIRIKNVYMLWFDVIFWANFHENLVQNVKFFTQNQSIYVLFQNNMVILRFYGLFWEVFFLHQNHDTMHETHFLQKFILCTVCVVQIFDISFVFFEKNVSFQTIKCEHKSDFL